LGVGDLSDIVHAEAKSDEPIAKQHFEKTAIGTVVMIVHATGSKSGVTSCGLVTFIDIDIPFLHK
jgi:hypothetical protein